MKTKISRIISAILSLILCVATFSFSSAVFAQNKLELRKGSYLAIDGQYLTNVPSKLTAGDLVSHFKGDDVKVYDTSGKAVGDEKYVGTGFKVSNSDSEKLYVVIRGEITGDGVVDTTDYVKLKSCFLGTLQLNGTYSLAADVDNSNDLTATDYIRIKLNFLGEYDLYPEASAFEGFEEEFSKEYFEVSYESGQAIYNDLGVSNSAPTYFQDFGESGITDTFANVTNLSYEACDGYVRFTTTNDDAYFFLERPTILSTSMRFVSIGYRTSVMTGGEFYVNRKLSDGLTDGAFMGQPGTNVRWNYGEATGLDGEFKRIVVDLGDLCGSKENFSEFRMDVATNAGSIVDIQYVAGFDNYDAAILFEYDNYHLKMINNQGEVEWPDPVYKEQTTVAEDTKISSVKITDLNFLGIHEISYVQNGETKTVYTTGGQNLSGGFSATDDTGASLSDSDVNGIYAHKERIDVGLFYFLWIGEHGDYGANDNDKIIKKYGTAAAALQAGAWEPSVSGVPYYAMYHWGEPLYGYYYSKDEWVVRKHMELLSNANIDFIFLDVTNGFTYVDNAKRIMKVIHQMNEEGFRAPRVVFYTNANSSATAEYLYQEIYAKYYYPDTWYGELVSLDPYVFKPYIVAENYQNDFFYVKSPQWPTFPQSAGEPWPWMDFDFDGDGKQQIYPGGNISVSVAQHNGNCCFSTSALYGINTNSGRTTVGPNEANSFFPVLPDSYKYGFNFQRQWNNVFEYLENGADINRVMVTGWNEWVAQKNPGTLIGNFEFVDCMTPEYSRDIEMTRGLYFDNYYMQLIRNVQKLNGSAPIIIQDGRKPINVTGDFTQWGDVTVLYTDPSGDCADRCTTAFGRVDTKNQTGRNDIVEAKVISDTKNIYFYVKTKNDISMYDTTSSWMQLFVSTDSNETNGWYGYDYIINYKASDCFTTTVAKNVKAGMYSFETIGEVSYRVKDNEMMIAVPLEMIGITDYTNINVDFKWADSTVKITNMEAFYELGDSAPLGRLNWVYRNK